LAIGSKRGLMQTLCQRVNVCTHGHMQTNIRKTQFRVTEQCPREGDWPLVILPMVTACSAVSLSSYTCSDSERALVCAISTSFLVAVAIDASMWPVVNRHSQLDINGNVDFHLWPLFASVQTNSLA